jgi:hypothetical protein
MSTEQNESQDIQTDDLENLGSMFSEALSGQAQPEVPTQTEPQQPEQVRTEPTQPIQQQPEPVAQPAPAPAPAQPAAQVDPFQQLAENARRLGITVDGVQSADQLAAAMLKQIEQMQPHVRVAQEIAPYADEFRQYVASRNNPVPPPVTPQQQAANDEWNAGEYFAKQYGGPVFTDQHRQVLESGYVERNPDTGLWMAKPGYEAVVADKLPELNAAQSHMTRFWQGLSSSNPYEKFFSVLQEPLLRQVRQEVEKMVAGREQVSREVSTVERFENEHKGWLYQTDPMTGQTVPSDRGKQFFATVADLKSKGMTDHMAILDVASRIHNVNAQPTQVIASPVAQPTQPQPPAAQPSALQMLQQQAAATRQTFLESAAQRAGYSPSYTADVTSPSPAAPEVSDQAELESMFSNALRRASAG